jgi:hypothetical protein
MTKTFFTLLGLSDLKAKKPKAKEPEREAEPKEKVEDLTKAGSGYQSGGGHLRPSGLHYNIQIHLPATKDVEVYNAIFKSLREHLVED